jgi:cytochrome c biogenesis protein CcmG/thiol:disulfide interchange protein DsbE
MRRMRAKHRLMRVRTIALALAGALAAAGCSSHAREAGNVTGVAAVGAPAPAFDDATAGGGMLSSSALRGKAVYLNFFASWCPPCNAEAPALERLQRRYASRGLQIVGVDVLEDAAIARSFARKYGLTYPIVVDGGALVHAYAVNGLPVHAFIDRDGVLRAVVVGELDERQMIAHVRTLVAPSAPRR